MLATVELIHPTSKNTFSNLHRDVPEGIGAAAGRGGVERVDGGWMCGPELLGVGRRSR
jgi:hypothetical protein